MQCSRLFSSI
ncbi:hypothetical protein CIB84_012996 [Bambusicola thoracicus]|uniref:Uncharacterized protein n=1 Tax=Bambusicola thoracicus TaxID=9083 RepID=A0A2P4SGP0_BAMTH|nr:hypothetical protein CIB84_012996 [Bambusicola thoracicus]